jgi:hypothetical protein
MVLMDVLIELHDFVSYITALPMKAAGYRVGSLLCVLPAYQTILKAVQSHNKLFTSEHDIKIPRLTFYHCLRDARSIASSNNAIMRYRDEIEGRVDDVFSTASGYVNEIENWELGCAGSNR